MSKCGSCSTAITKQKPGISCQARCKKSYHISCAKIPPEFSKLLDVPGLTWRCNECVNNDTPVDADVSSLETNSVICIMKSIQSDIKALSSKYDTLLDSVSFCSEKVSNFENALLKLDTRVSATEKLVNENVALKNEIMNLTDRMNNLEQYTRTNNLEIQGVNEKIGENVYNILEIIGNAINCDISRNDIDTAHRVSHLSPNNKNPKAIIVRFSSRMKRDAFLAAAKNTRNATNKQEPGIAIPNISNRLFINEHLTNQNKTLLSKAKSVAKEKNFKYVWSKNGYIFMRRNDTSGIYKVNCVSDLEKLT